MRETERLKVGQITAIIDIALRNGHSETYFFFDGRFYTETFLSQKLSPLGRPQLAGRCPNLTESLNYQWISRHYIIFLTPTHFSSGSQFTWFISAVSLFTLVHNVFRNPKLTCCQKSTFNKMFYCVCYSINWEKKYEWPKSHQYRKRNWRDRFTFSPCLLKWYDILLPV